MAERRSVRVGQVSRVWRAIAGPSYVTYYASLCRRVASRRCRVARGGAVGVCRAECDAWGEMAAVNDPWAGRLARLNVSGGEPDMAGHLRLPGCEQTCSFVAAFAAGNSDGGNHGVQHLLTVQPRAPVWILGAGVPMCTHFVPA